MRNLPAFIAAITAVGCLAGPVAAQELVFGFKNPSFGGNPFYSDHLLAIATAQRPERPRDPSDTTELTEAEQFARQIQSRLLSALSSSLVEAITGSAPGTTGEFVVGDQTIFFERSLTTIRLVITNNVTGEATEIIVPVLNFNNPTTSATAGVTNASASQAGSLIAGSGQLIGGASQLGQSPLTGGSLSTGSLNPLPAGL